MFAVRFVLWTLVFGMVQATLFSGLDFSKGKPFLYWTSLPGLQLFLPVLAIAAGLLLAAFFKKPKAV